MPTPCTASGALSDVALYAENDRRRAREEKLLQARLAGLVIAVIGTIGMLLWCFLGEIPLYGVSKGTHYWELLQRVVGVISTSGAGLCFWIAVPAEDRLPLYERLRPDR